MIRFESGTASLLEFNILLASGYVLALHQPASLNEGPIPARTGEPGIQPDAVRIQWAYPRSHG